MSRYHSYLNTSGQIIQQYKGDEPFASFIKKYFSADPKFGSNDRKWISHICYCFFRLGKALPDLPIEERLLAGLFLCSNEPNQILSQLKPQLNEKTGFTLREKCSMVNGQSSMLNVFPWKDKLSAEMEYESFSESFFIQPDLFLRIRPGNETLVLGKLQSAGLSYTFSGPDCLALPNSSKLSGVIETDKEAVVQDLNSQKLGELIKLIRPLDQVWDCCAGSGGKSILLHDMNPGIDLTVSDSRETILINLKKRFKNAGIERYKSFIADLSSAKPKIHNLISKIILADLPCTGSGTWSRTPEQLYYFEEEKIEEYATLQKKIISNIIPHLADRGYLLYITCSVFKTENEEVVSHIQEKYRLELVKQQLFTGYHNKADTLFAALLKKPL